VTGEPESARFKRAGGIRAFFLQKGRGMALARQHGGPTFAERDGSHVRQNGPVAPHAGPGRFCRVPGDGIARSFAVQMLKIVADLQ